MSDAIATKTTPHTPTRDYTYFERVLLETIERFRAQLAEKDKRIAELEADLFDARNPGLGDCSHA